MRLLLLLLCWFAIHSTRAASEIPIKIYTEELLFLQIKAGDEATGFAVELLKKIMEQAKLSGSIDFYPWARAYKETQKQKNALLFSTRRTQFRENKFIWASPLFPSFYQAWYSAINLVLICRSDFPLDITSLEQAKQFTLVGQRGNFMTEIAQYQLGWPSSKIIFTTRYADTLTLLQKGRADFMLIGQDAVSQVTYQLELDKETFKICFEAISTNADLYYAFSPNTDVEVIARFRSAFDALVTSKEYHKLYLAWAKKAGIKLTR